MSGIDSHDFCIGDCGISPPTSEWICILQYNVEGGEVFYQFREGYSPSDKHVYSLHS